MMNSTVDDFGDNPFRSSTAPTNDVFFDAAAAPSPQQPQMQPQMQQQPAMAGAPMMMNNNQPNQFQQQQSPPLSSPSPMMNNNGMSFTPQPSGPMDGMNGGGGGGMTMQQPQQPQPMMQGGPAGLMSPQQQVSQQQQQQQQPTSWWGNLLMCLNLDSYKQYFNIDADDIVTRIRGVFLHFYKPEYFRNNVIGTASMSDLKGPDLYGPFWITMTLVFLIGVTANMHHYLHSTMDDLAEFDYDINHLLHAGWVCFGYSFVLPLLLWTTTYCGMNLTSLQLVEWVCIYGYSMTPYLPAVILCIIPFGLVSWILLGIATGVSVVLVLRNIAPVLVASDTSHAKSPPVLLVVIGSAVVFLLVLKIGFYHYSSPS